MCEKKSREERLKFIGEHFGLVGVLPSTGEYMGWCERNASSISRMSAVRDIKQIANELGITIKEQPKHLKELSHSKITLSTPAEKKVKEQVPIVEKPKVLDPSVKKELVKELFERNDKKFGKSWRNTITRIGDVNHEADEMISRGVYHLADA